MAADVTIETYPELATEGHVLLDATSQSMARADSRVRDALNSPHAVAATAAILLQHPGFSFGKTARQLVTQRTNRRIQPRVRSPTHLAGAEQHILRAHFQDRVGVRADEDRFVGDMSQQRVQKGPVAAPYDRVYPHEHPVDMQ